MSLRNVVDAWVTWSRLTGSSDDSWADRLNHVYTVVITVFFAFLVTAGTYISEPIVCIYKQITQLEKMLAGNKYKTRAALISAVIHNLKQQVYVMVQSGNTKASQEDGKTVLQKYANYICWINNTYYVPMHGDIPSRPTDRLDTEIPYYQYVPLMLLVMALLFKIPSIIWRQLSGYSGIDLAKIAELTIAANYVDDSQRAKRVDEIAMCIDRWLESTRQYHWNFLVRLRQRASRLCFMLNRREGTYLTGLYLMVKVLYTVNVIGQFFLLDEFLGGIFSLWGFEFLDNLADRAGFRESKRFPRVTLCDFQIRQMDNVHRYTVLCVLPMNIFNERIFLFLWFWLVFVTIVTIIDLLRWFAKTVCRGNRVVLLKKYLTIHGRLQTETDKKICRKFAEYIRDDGAFLIRMMQKNSNDILVSELVAKLWDRFLEKKMAQKLLNDNNSHTMSLRTVS